VRADPGARVEVVQGQLVEAFVVAAVELAEDVVLGVGQVEPVGVDLGGPAGPVPVEQGGTTADAIGELPGRAERSGGMVHAASLGLVGWRAVRGRPWPGSGIGPRTGPGPGHA
jgi:hypothetical protein